MLNTNNNFWTGEKVRLRAVTLSDADNYFKYGMDYDDEADRYCDMIYFPRNYDQLKKSVEKWSQEEPKNDEFFLIITDLDGNPVGNIGTQRCDRKNGTFQYGLGIIREARNKGYAADAIKLLLKYMFLELRYQKVTAYVYAFNEPSIKLHEKLGFVQEGRLRRAIYTNGEYFDEIFFGMTKEEFDEKLNKPSEL